jgi:hypothetical protein
MMTTTEKAFVGTQPVASLHGRCIAEDTIETTATYTMPSTLEIHAAKLKDGAKIGSMKSKNSAMKGTMIIMVLTRTKLTRSGHRKWDTSQEASRQIP